MSSQQGTGIAFSAFDISPPSDASVISTTNPPPSLNPPTRQQEETTSDGSQIALNKESLDNAFSGHP
jgi:hypothetical protein